MQNRTLDILIHNSFGCAIHNPFVILYTHCMASTGVDISYGGLAKPTTASAVNVLSFTCVNVHKTSKRNFEQVFILEILYVMRFNGKFS